MTRMQSRHGFAQLCFCFYSCLWSFDRLFPSMLLQVLSSTQACNWSGLGFPSFCSQLFDAWRMSFMATQMDSEDRGYQPLTARPRIWASFRCRGPAVWGATVVWVRGLQTSLDQKCTARHPDIRRCVDPVYFTGAAWMYIASNSILSVFGGFLYQPCLCISFFVGTARFQSHFEPHCQTHVRITSPTVAPERPKRVCDDFVGFLLASLQVSIHQMCRQETRECTHTVFCLTNKSSAKNLDGGSARVIVLQCLKRNYYTVYFASVLVLDRSFSRF